MSICYLDTKQKKLCCGCKVCGLVCSKNAITFVSDEEGFWYPEIDETRCIHCNKCRITCPLNDKELPIITESNQTYAAYSKSEDVLKHSASGGLFTALSDVILEEGGTVFGHIYDENCVVICSIARTKEQRNKMCGSKYVQSDMRNIYEKVKAATQTNKSVLFTGTPCQVEAVKKYFGKSIPENLYTVGIICHGVPSPKIFSEYVSLEQKKRKRTIKEVVFRDKGKGWSTPLIRHCYADGSYSTKLLSTDAFNNLFLGLDCILRPSCFECKYAGKQRVDDISIADFWGIQNNHMDMFNNDKGVSLVLVNTEKGKQLFSKVEKKIVFKQVSLSDAQEKNTPLNHSTVPFKNRDKVFKEYNKFGAKFILNKYMIQNKFLTSILFRGCRKLIRMLRRLFYF